MKIPTVSVRPAPVARWTVDVTPHNQDDERFPIQASPNFAYHADADDTTRVLRGALADAYLAGRADAERDADTRRRLDDNTYEEATR